MVTSLICSHIYILANSHTFSFQKTLFKCGELIKVIPQSQGQFAVPCPSVPPCAEHMISRPCQLVPGSRSVRTIVKAESSDKRDQLQAGSGSEKERAEEPVSIVLKTSFRPLEKRNRLVSKCQNPCMFSIELLA